MHPDRLEQPYRDPDGEHRGAAVGDERQRQTGDGHDAQGHADVLEGLEGEPGDDAGGDDRAVELGGLAGDAAGAPQDDAQQQDDQPGAQEAEFLAGDGEDEVGLLLGDELPGGLGAVEEARAGQPAAADGDARLVGVVADAGRVEAGLAKAAKRVIW